MKNRQGSKQRRHILLASASNLLPMSKQSPLSMTPSSPTFSVKSHCDVCFHNTHSRISRTRRMRLPPPRTQHLVHEPLFFDGLEISDVERPRRFKAQRCHPGLWPAQHRWWKWPSRCCCAPSNSGNGARHEHVETKTYFAEEPPLLWNIYARKPVYFQSRAVLLTRLSPLAPISHFRY